MVDISGRIDRIISEYIENGQYFTINRARQYGKTTTLYLLEKRLRENYIVLSLSFESADEYFQSLSSLAEGLQKLPRNSSPTRWKNRSIESGRPRSYMRRFGMDRISFREHASKGEIPGVTKASW